MGWQGRSLWGRGPRPIHDSDLRDVVECGWSPDRNSAQSPASNRDITLRDSKPQNKNRDEPGMSEKMQFSQIPNRSGLRTGLIASGLILSGIFIWIMDGKTMQPVNGQTTSRNGALKPSAIDGGRAYQYLKDICAIGPRPAGSAANQRQRPDGL